MIWEIFRSFFIGLVPVGLFTFLIMQWSISSGRMQRFDKDKDPREQYAEHLKAEKKRRKTEKVKYEYDKDGNWISGRKGGDFFHGKIMEFGGGYYGTMAFLCYVIIELGEIFEFLGKILVPGAWFQNLGWQLIIDFLINSIMNFVAALIWFITFADMFEIHHWWLWLGMTYAGYYAGMKLTSMHGDTMWAKLGEGWKYLLTYLEQLYNQVFSSIQSTSGDNSNKNSADGD